MSHYSDAENSVDSFEEPSAAILRRRRVWDSDNESITSEIKDLLEEDVNSLVFYCWYRIVDDVLWVIFQAEEEDCIGCPLPSTPEDENILENEMSDVFKAAVLGNLGSIILRGLQRKWWLGKDCFFVGDELDITTLAQNAAGQAEQVVRRLIQVSWNVCHFNKLPDWLQDNDFLTHGHRPPLPSFRACFRSIFRLHTETANIWTHLLGCVAFIGGYYLLSKVINSIESDQRLSKLFKLVFMYFYACFRFVTKVLYSFACRYCCIFFNASNGRDTTAREGCLRSILCRSHNMPRFLIHVPYIKLSFAIHRKTIFKTGLLRNSFTNNGFLCSMALLWILLSL